VGRLRDARDAQAVEAESELCVPCTLEEGGHMTEGPVPGPGPADAPKTHEVSLDADAYVTAATLAERRGVSIPQLLRTAVTTQRWFDDVRAAGGRGKLREILEIREKSQPERSVNQRSTQ
jgi:hypothetical protein